MNKFCSRNDATHGRRECDSWRHIYQKMSEISMVLQLQVTCHRGDLPGSHPLLSSGCPRPSAAYELGGDQGSLEAHHWTVALEQMHFNGLPTALRAGVECARQQYDHHWTEFF